ncbi:hypothetical protein [Novosphingobium sp. JCM 18896]|uniref:hypothetical protein n=1 Tax=Novosphingobium sp. JCM 18896 TaxID=2989731 RepID=UPI002221B7C7|nr:hypothetical protein [Novosphingobium sp. JCM 18896]MCW1431975.1 hypothetical protein [Novosphingobium sp. JCM 18896]
MSVMVVPFRPNPSLLPLFGLVACFGTVCAGFSIYQEPSLKTPLLAAEGFVIQKDSDSEPKKRSDINVIERLS